MDVPCELNGFFTGAERERMLQSATQRVSIRTYTGAPDEDETAALGTAAERCALPGVRLIPVRVSAEKLYRVLPAVGGVRGTDYSVAVVAEKTEQARIYAGVSGEALVLLAVSMGLGTCWIGSARTRVLDIKLEENECIMGVIAIGHYEKQKILRKRKKLTEICSTDPVSWPFWAYNAAETVRIAPSAMNLQPWRLDYAGHSLLLRSRGLCSPLDKGIALLHLHIGVGSREHELDWTDDRCIARLRISGGINA